MFLYLWYLRQMVSDCQIVFLHSNDRIYCVWWWSLHALLFILYCVWALCIALMETLCSWNELHCYITISDQGISQPQKATFKQKKKHHSDFCVLLLWLTVIFKCLMLYCNELSCGQLFWIAILHSIYSLTYLRDNRDVWVEW